MPTLDQLKEYQAQPLELKEIMSKQKIREWRNYWDGNVCISFSGGKDSTALSHLVHSVYPEVPLIFCDTGLEFPEIKEFAKKMGAETIRPTLNFSEVISKYGYPIITKEVSESIYYARRIRNSGGALESEASTVSQRQKMLGKSFGKGYTKSIYSKEKWLPLAEETPFKISYMCCKVMKKYPFKHFHRKRHMHSYVGTLTEESLLRRQAWLRTGCNAYTSDIAISQPMAFWLEQDVLQYILNNGLEIASVYGDIVHDEDDGRLKCTGCQRTGCVFCGFGVHLEKGETRFQRLAKTHPKLHDYCLRGGQWVDNPEYDPVAPKMDGAWENWNPKKIWVPSKEGLGMRYVFDECNKLYGKYFIRYE